LHPFQNLFPGRYQKFRIHDSHDRPSNQQSRNAAIHMRINWTQHHPFKLYWSFIGLCSKINIIMHSIR
jgi:hypothetical protein